MLILFLSFSLYAEPMKKSDRWSELMGLITQEMKILSSARKKGIELNYRMLELHSEKLKLIHEKNNLDFIRNSKTRAAAAKEDFFLETRSYYQLTKDFGLKILRDFPDNHRRAEIHYTLGLNSRDYGRDNLTESNLLQSIALVKDPHHSLRHHAETALADYYYNEKRFFDAIAYYEKAIKKTEDEWMTKHLFNLSWCYLKIREFDRAIETITQSYKHSKNPSYIDIRDQVLENIGAFYVYAGHPIEGMNFYVQNEKDPVPYLIKMSVKASEKGHEKETETILSTAQRIIDDKQLSGHQEELYHTYLDFYRHYSKFREHESISRLLVSYYRKLPSEDDSKPKATLRDEAIEKMRSVAGVLQMKLAKDMKEDGGDFKEEELKLVLSYFQHLFSLDPSRRGEYYYFRAETYFSVHRYGPAALAYVDAVAEARRTKNDEMARKCLNSMLVLTAMEVLPKEENKKFLTFAYSSHLSIWPRDVRSEKIYPKLFAIYHEEANDQKSTAILQAFHKYYPEHLEEQQVLMTKVLDQFIENKATEKLAVWINHFKGGLFSFPKETVEKTEIVLGSILFLQFQEMAKKGDKLAAARGFESIFVHKLYPDKVKWQSAFLAAMTYLELSETQLTYKWLLLAHGRMTEEELLSRRREELSITERSYKLQDFETSFKIAELLLGRFCHLKDEVQSRFFEISVMTSLVDQRPAEAERIVTKHLHCLKENSTKEIALSQIYQFHEKRGDFHSLRPFMKRHQVEPYLTLYRNTLQKWYWEKSSLTLKDNVKEELKTLKHPEAQAWVKEIDQYSRALLHINELKELNLWSGLAFDGTKFNQSLESYLMKVQQFKDQFAHLNQSTQIDLAILSTKLFSDLYLFVSKKIEEVHPSGMDAQTSKDFQLAMKDLSRKFLAASTQYQQQLLKALNEKESMVWGSRTIASVEQIENPIFSFFTGVTMDRAKE